MTRHRARRADEQLELRFPNRWGGARQKAGRKAGKRRAVPHRARPAHRPSVPEHVTLRVRLRSLRSQFVFPTVRRALADANERGGARFRIVHFSVQSHHLHLIVEALERRDLIEGLRGLSVSLARRINRLLFRRGPLSAERWHGRPLPSPRAVRHALVYLLGNAKKHGEPVGELDPLSSAPFFRGFRGFAGRAPLELRPELVPRLARAPAPPPPCTWLLATGWLKHGRISLSEAPRVQAR
jgi:putative transposase